MHGRIKLNSNVHNYLMSQLKKQYLFIENAESPRYSGAGPERSRT